MRTHDHPEQHRVQNRTGRESQEVDERSCHCASLYEATVWFNNGCPVNGMIQPSNGGFAQVSVSCCPSQPRADVPLARASGGCGPTLRTSKTPLPWLRRGGCALK